MSLPKVTVYTKDDCVQCKYTKSFLDDEQVVYTEVHIAENPAGEAMLRELRDKGFVTMPVVKVEYERQTQWWNGFKLEKIRDLCHAWRMGLHPDS